MDKQSLDEKIEFEGKWIGGFFIEDDGYDSGEFTMSIKLKPDKSFIGLTRDKNGLAFVKGELNNGTIKFTKKYITATATENAVKDNIIYEGKAVYSNLEYEGKWRLEWHDDFHYKFDLRRI